jgi:HdeA/HdeB family
LQQTRAVDSRDEQVINQTKEGIMNKHSTIVSASVGLVLGSLAAALPARAESKSKQVDMITCEEFLAMNPDSQQRIAYWVDGYQEGKGHSAIEVIELNKFGQPIDEMVKDCKATPKETLWQKVKKHL